jgi:uncharacterized LabA/DUF88 family protein
MFNVYVDGESHFIRSEKCWQSLHKDATLEQLETTRRGNDFQFPLGSAHVRLDRAAKFFWDPALARFTRNNPVREWIGRAVYFTSAVGDAQALHARRLAIRSHEFEPQVVSEPKTLADQRANLLSTQGVIERAKGVDVGLAVRILEDAYFNTFEGCLLLTSDVDFLPVIRSVRQTGKLVYVLGYRGGLGKHSPLEYEPDLFIDLGEIMSKEYRLKQDPGASQLAASPAPVM